MHDKVPTINDADFPLNQRWRNLMVCQQKCTRDVVLRLRQFRCTQYKMHFCSTLATISRQLWWDRSNNVLHHAVLNVQSIVNVETESNLARKALEMQLKDQNNATLDCKLKEKRIQVRLSLFLDMRRAFAKEAACIQEKMAILKQNQAIFVKQSNQPGNAGLILQIDQHCSRLQNLIKASYDLRSRINDFKAELQGLGSEHNECLKRVKEIELLTKNATFLNLKHFFKCDVLLRLAQSVYYVVVKSENEREAIFLALHLDQFSPKDDEAIAPEDVIYMPNASRGTKAVVNNMLTIQLNESKSKIRKLESKLNLLESTNKQLYEQYQVKKITIGPKHHNVY